jgi:hypothetical protein
MSCREDHPGHSLSRSLLFLLVPILYVAGSINVVGATPPDFVWPIGNSTMPDTMNTSFGPRVNFSKWDYHDGIDLPEPAGADCTQSVNNTTLHAVRGGTVHHAGSAGTGGLSSRHVVLKVTDPYDGGDLYVYYLHLKSIAPALLQSPPPPVAQGDTIGVLGQDGASYCHLHLEFRKGNTQQVSSLHPLNYMPYTDTANFSAPSSSSARYNRLGSSMAARLLFGASSKEQGDLQRVEVDLKNGSALLSTRVVDFDDKTTVNEANDDAAMWVNDIAVEGYQTSDMSEDGRTDLKYGVLVRNLPSNCDALVARIIDVRGNTATSAAISVPNQTAVDQSVSFEDASMPPAGWATAITSGLTATNDAGVGYNGTRGMNSNDSSTASATQKAGIEYTLGMNRFQWTAEGQFKPTALGLSSSQTLQPLYFFNGSDLAVSARIRPDPGGSGSKLAGIQAKEAAGAGSGPGTDSAAAIATGVYRKWKLSILRLGTRESTAVLYLDNVEQARMTWDSTSLEPAKLRAGIGLTSSGATGTVHTDDLRLTETL